MLPEIIVEIYKIATPKCGYFVFWETKSKRLDINSEPFKIKEGDSKYPFEHHISGEDLLFFRKFNENIFLYNKQFTAQSWEDAMKYEIYTIIVHGWLDRKSKVADVFVRFVWTGEKMKQGKLLYK